MKKFFQALEDLWVAAAFAEAGVYESLAKKPQPLYKEAAELRAV